MSPFNHLEFVGHCPSCGDGAALIRAQFYVGSSFEGNEKGIFAGKFYRIGDRINWFEKNDPEYPSWMLPDVMPKLDGMPNEVIEVCEAECMGCGFENLRVVILFQDLRPVRILDLDYDKNINSVFPYIAQYEKERSRR